jgi:phosphodiesterase/alkaline phosphatase D-like protein
VAIDGVADGAHAGTVATFPAGAADIIVAFASCAETGSSAVVFDQIRAEEPDVFIHMGDLHYEDITRNDIELFRTAYDAVLAAPAQSALYRSVPLAYVWDDHDFGANNSTSRSPSREAALRSYAEYVPHYPLAGGESPIYQAFTIGRVRILLTDTRSARDPRADTMLGAEQKAWLMSELLASRDAYALAVWVNPSPWIAPADVAARLEGTWGAFPNERSELARFIADNGLDNIVMLSGDAHMLAIDDGTNNRYADPNGPPGFPVMHAAAMDRDGSVKGGPYSEGAFPGTGQYGLMRVTDDGGESVTVDWSGWNASGERVVGLRMTVPRKPDG